LSPGARKDPFACSDGKLIRANLQVMILRPGP